MKEYLMSVGAVALVGVIWECTAYLHVLDPLFEPLFQRLEKVARALAS